MSGREKMSEDLCGRLSQLLDGVPASEMKKNSRAVATAILSRLDVVSREEFDAHCEMLANAMAQLEVLEDKIRQLQSQQRKDNSD